jgi:hypothetical protein
MKTNLDSQPEALLDDMGRKVHSLRGDHILLFTHFLSDYTIESKNTIHFP